MKTSSPSLWRRPGARRIVAVAGVSAVVLAAAVGPSSASGSGGGSNSVTVATSVNGIVDAPAFTGETSKVALTLTNQTLKTLAGYVVVAPSGLGSVTSLGVSNPGWSQKATGCGFVSNCSAIFFVTAKTSGARLSKGASITSSFAVTPTAAGTAQFRILGVGDDYSGLTVVGAQPSISIVDGVATTLRVAVSPPVVKGEPNSVTVTSLREYPAGTFTPRPFPGALTFTAGNGDTLDYTAPDVTGLTQVTVPVTFPNVQVSPKQTLTASSGAISGSTSLEVVAAGVVSDAAKVVLTGAGGTTYTATLSNGSNGPVSFTEVPCDALAGDPDCTTEVNLFGNFKDSEGQPLYSNDAPAEIGWTCPVEECPSTPAVYGSFTQDQVVDFQNYRIQVSLLVDGEYTAFADAEPCNPIVTNPANVVTGKITDPDAQAAGFCVDVYAISRAGNSFGGDLTIPVLFVEDPKLRGI